MSSPQTFTKNRSYARSWELNGESHRTWVVREGDQGAGIAEAGQHASPGHSLQWRVMRASQRLPRQLSLGERGPNHRVWRELLGGPRRGTGCPEAFPVPHPQIKRKMENGGGLLAGRVPWTQRHVLGRMKLSWFCRGPESPGPQLLQDQLMVLSYPLRGTVLGSHS